MNPTETMKQAIIERAAQLVAERMFEEMNQSPAQHVPPPGRQSEEDAEWSRRMEELAGAQMAAGGLGPRPNYIIRRKRIFGGNPTLMRGRNKPAKQYSKLPNSSVRRMMQLAWDSLHEDGHFTSGRAARNDLTRYLIESLPEIPTSSFSSNITRAIRDGVLAIVPEGF